MLLKYLQLSSLMFLNFLQLSNFMVNDHQLTCHSNQFRFRFWCHHINTVITLSIGTDKPEQTVDPDPDQISDQGLN